jgi:DNA-binding response OmpR family regulator
MKRILVVDDEESIRELYRAELAEEGYEVDLAGDGLQA